nr:hypothetical protein [Candidatus Woesearchaeota archaeon]
MKNLNQEKINRIFSIYQEIINKPVITPSLDEIKDKLERNIAYEYAAKGFQWTSKLRFSRKDEILIEFVYNERVPKFMIESLKLMKKDFEEKIKDI